METRGIGSLQVSVVGLGCNNFGKRYGEQEPAQVLADLKTEVARLATSFEAVTPEQWERPGRRSDGAVSTIDTFARYLLHDVVHHGWDVTGVEAAE